MINAWAALLSGTANNSMFIGAGGVASTAPTNLALSSPYVYGVSGAASAWFFTANETTTLTDIYIYVASVTGGGPVLGTVSWELRESLAASGIPGSTLTASGTISAAASGWQLATGITASITAGKIYAIVIGDPAGNGTNFATINIGAGNSTLGATKYNTAYSTANGFSTAATAAAKLSYAAWQAGGIWYGGACFDTVATVTTGTYERGVRFQVPCAMTLAGIIETEGDLGLIHTASAINLYADGTATGGTALTSFTFPAYTLTGTAPDPINIIFPQANWYTLSANTWYRLVFKPSSTTTIPRKNTGAATIPTGVRSGCFPLGGNCYYTDASSGSFVDNTNQMCLMGPLLVPTLVSPSAGGGFLIE